MVPSSSADNETDNGNGHNGNDVEFKKDYQYSWVVLAASFLSLFLCMGIPLSFGIFVIALYEHFKSTNEKAEVVAVGSIAYGILNLTSPLSTILYRKFGCRSVVVSGALISSFGLSCSFFATDLRYLYVTYGILGGFGFGLIFAPSIAILPEYFDRFKYFAVSFATVGSAVGTLIMPQLVDFLVERYRWQGALLLSGGLMTHIVVFGMLMKSRGAGALVKKSVVHLSDETRPGGAKQSIWKQERVVFKDSSFYLLCVDAAFFGGSSYTVFILVSNFAQNRGLEHSRAVLLVSILGISNLIGRISASLIGQRSKTNRQLFFACLTLWCSLATFFTAFCTTFVSFIVCLVAYGAAYGGRISQMSPMLIDTFGVERMATVLGYYLFTGGIGALVIPIISGKLTDLFDSSTAILFSASVTLCDAAICFVVIILTSIKKRRQIADDIFTIDD